MTDTIILTGAELHSGGKAVFLSGHVDSEATDQELRVRKFYFPLSQCELIDDEYHCPLWLAEAKAAEVVYQWVSNRGMKGIDHLGGAALSASFADRVFYIDSYRLNKAKDYLERSA
tara:strand:- start:383 stop:730 length:348 start_codon:yes stop_codon:yes gene_type:complete